MSEVLMILQDQIRRYGGAYGVRDTALLSSALAMPSSTFEGKYLHDSLHDQAAAYAFHVCQNHPFLGGNKRTAFATALVFLAVNGIELDDPKEELYGLMMKVAEGDAQEPEVAAKFRSLEIKKKQRH